jgi:hypothetical protein
MAGFGGLSGFRGLVENPTELIGNSLANMPAQMAQLQMMGAQALQPYGQALKANPELWNDRAWRARVDSLGGMYGIPTASMVVGQATGVAPTDQQQAQQQTQQPQTQGQQPQAQQQGTQQPQQPPNVQTGQPQPGRTQAQTGQTQPQTMLGSGPRLAYESALARAQQMPSLISGSTPQSRAYIKHLQALGANAALDPQQVATDIHKASLAHAVRPGTSPVVTQPQQQMQVPQGQQMQVPQGQQMQAPTNDQGAQQIGNEVASQMTGQQTGQAQGQWVPQPMTPEEQMSAAETPLLSFLGVKPNMVPLQDAGLTYQDIQGLMELAPGAGRAAALAQYGVNVRDPDAVGLINAPQLMGTPGQVWTNVRDLEGAMSRNAQQGNIGGVLTAFTTLQQLDPTTAEEIEPSVVDQLQTFAVTRYQNAIDQGLLSKQRGNLIISQIRSANTLDEYREASTAHTWATIQEMPEELQIKAQNAASNAERAMAAASQAATASGRLNYDYFQQTAQNYRNLNTAYTTFVKTMATIAGSNIGFDPTTTMLPGPNGQMMTASQMAQLLGSMRDQAKQQMDSFPNAIRGQIPGKPPGGGGGGQQPQPPVHPGYQYYDTMNGRYRYRKLDADGQPAGNELYFIGGPSGAHTSQTSSSQPS